MSSLDMTLLNVDKLNEQLRGFGEAAEKQALKGMKRAMMPMRKEILASLTANGKSGRLYPRGGGKYHQASAPGEAPSSDTSELRDQISLPLENREELSVSVISRAPYSSDLEYGTSKMAARPFMTPAFLNNKEYMKEAIRITLKAIFNEHGGGGSDE